MIELLQDAATRDPSQPAVLGRELVTYGELLDRSLDVAAALRERGLRRVAAVVADVPGAVSVLAGGSAAGVEVCLYAPDAAPDMVRDLLVRFDHSALVTDRADLDGVAPTVVGPAELAGDHSDANARSSEPGAARPLLVLTTGTTGTPKGVRHDWSRLLRGAVRGTPPEPEARWLFVYGIHQFAALQLLLHVVASHATLVVPPEHRPGAAVEVADAHAVTHVSATPTFWRFFLAELRAAGRRPPLRQITLGGEAVPGDLVATLADQFPDARISQVYAASEFGQTGSVRDGRPGLPVEVLERGEDADVALQLRDGELWVRSRVGMLGYYGEEPVDPDEWRPTGDLAEVVGDRVEFRGRTSEVINVGGVKVHPLPVEELVCSVSGVRAARAFGRANRLTGHIVAVEVVLDPGHDEETVRDRVRDACEVLVPAARPRSVRIVEELPMNSGKLVRGGSA